MYLYLYDNFLKQKNFDSVVGTIETRLTDYEIAGKVLRLSHFTSEYDIIVDEARRGVKTVVIVGNDATFGRVLSRSASIDMTFGFIPVGPKNDIANVLGIPVGEGACDVLSRRRVVPLDVGWFNNRYFVSQLSIPPSDIEVNYDDRFTVRPGNASMELVVCNLQPYVFVTKGQKDIVVHPQDGKLEAFLRPVVKSGWFGKHYEEPSIFPFEQMRVRGSRAFTVVADGKESKEVDIQIRLAKGKIKMIVGKERRF